MSFLECYLNSMTKFSMLDDWVEYWHTHNTHNELIEFLGFDEEDYFEFMTYSYIRFKFYIDKKYKKKK